MKKMEERVGLRLDFFVEDNSVDRDTETRNSWVSCGRAKETRGINKDNLVSYITCADCGDSFNICL